MLFSVINFLRKSKTTVIIIIVVLQKKQSKGNPDCIAVSTGRQRKGARRFAPQFWEGTPARPPFSRLIAAEKEAYFFLLYGVSESGSSVRSFPSYWK